MSDSTVSELEIVNPSPVRAHTNSFVAQKTKEKRKRDHFSSIDAETRAKQRQNADFYTQKGKLFRKFCSIWMDQSRQSVLSAHCIGDTHKKHNGTNFWWGLLHVLNVSSFTYYNKVLFPDRTSLKSETVKQLMFSYSNSDFSWIHFLYW